MPCPVVPSDQLAARWEPPNEPRARQLPLTAGGTVNEDQISSARANLRRAIAAFEAIGGLARTQTRPWNPLPPATNRSPGQDHARLSRMLCALRHLTDQFGEISFGDMLSAAHERYRLLGAGYVRPAAAPKVAMADEAIGMCERNIAAPRQYRAGFWPPDTLSYLRGYAILHELRFESAVASLTTGLIAGLRHYADYKGTSFEEALAAGLRAHARQRLCAEGPFQIGQDSAGLPAPESLPSPAAQFQPTATNQGVVTSPADAEWLLIRTAARNQERGQRGLPGASPRDADDQRVLAEALAETCGQSAREILTGLAPRIVARVIRIEHGPAAAAELGREHGRTGTQPYCDLEIDGDASALLRALGETELMTNANHPYRVSLVIAYVEAYRQAAKHDAADSPARIAARSFPQANQSSAQAGTPGAPEPSHQERVTPQATPRYGSPPGAR
jgi:hypothetical protein